MSCILHVQIIELSSVILWVNCCCRVNQPKVKYLRCKTVDHKSTAAIYKISHFIPKPCLGPNFGISSMNSTILFVTLEVIQLDCSVINLPVLIFFFGIFLQDFFLDFFMLQHFRAAEFLQELLSSLAEILDCRMVREYGKQEACVFILIVN